MLFFCRVVLHCCIPRILPLLLNVELVRVCHDEAVLPLGNTLLLLVDLLSHERRVFNPLGYSIAAIASLLGYLASALAWVFGELLKHSVVNSVTWLG